MYDLLKVKFRIQIAESRIRHACQVCCSSCALIMLHLSLYARQGCQILLGAPKPMLTPSLTSIFSGEKSQNGDTDSNF